MFRSSSQWVPNMFQMCSFRLFLIAPSFNPISFAQSPPPSHLCRWWAQGGGTPYFQGIFYFGEPPEFSTFFFCDGPIKLAHCNQNKRTCEASHLINATENVLLHLVVLGISSGWTLGYFYFTHVDGVASRVHQCWTGVSISKNLPIFITVWYKYMHKDSLIEYKSGKCSSILGWIQVWDMSFFFPPFWYWGHISTTVA
jgi:hypothetical protein